MRTLGILLLSALVLSCGNDPETPPAPADAASLADAADVLVPADLPPADPGPAPDPGPPPADTKPPKETTPPDVGPPANPMVCTGNVEGELQPFGGACCYTGASNPQNPSCVWYADDYGNGECLDAQCETGLCSSAAYCTRPCDVGTDKVVNATGAAGSDGVADPTGTNDCNGAADGPYGAEYRCINERAPDKEPSGYCKPGTTFKACDATADCPAGEVCDLLFVQGKTQARCVRSPKGALPNTSECNSDPAAGELTTCAGYGCFAGEWCVDLCGSDGDCLTDTCTEGHCAKDPAHACTKSSECSAWSCQELKPYSNSEYVDEFCQPRPCAKAADCPDPDWFCRPFWNGADAVEDVAFSPECRKKGTGLADYGEPCGFDGDGSGLPACVSATGCHDHVCGGPCQSDADCSDGAACLLAAEWDIDVNGDDKTDTTLNVDMCQAWAHDGELADCLSDADCPAGHHCQYRVRGQGLGADRAWEVEYKCKKDASGTVLFGAVCGGTSGKVCASDLCLAPSGSDASVKRMCSEYCAGTSDCPSTVDFGGYTYKTICLSLTVDAQNTPDVVDDLYVPYCWKVDSASSLEPCDEHKGCGPKEYCRALAVAGNPDEAVKVEHLCVFVGDNLTKLPTKDVGEPCTAGSECLGRACLPDGTGGGYCSRLCGSDLDCATETGLQGLACTQQTLVPRPNPADAGLTERCVLAKACIPCTTDNDCGGGYLCANFGGLGFTADLRCGKPCESDSDCPDVDSSCEEDLDAKGKPSGKKVCVLEACPG